MPSLVQKHALSAVTVLLFGLAFWRLGLSPELPATLAFIFGGVLLAVIDWKVQRLPTAPRVLHARGRDCWARVRITRRVGLEASRRRDRRCRAFRRSVFRDLVLVAAVLGMVVLGFGDVRLALVLGALLGWYGLNYVLYGALLGHVLATVIGLGLCIRERKLRLSFAFGPPLLMGTLAVVLLQA